MINFDNIDAAIKKTENIINEIGFNDKEMAYFAATLNANICDFFERSKKQSLEFRRSFLTEVAEVALKMLEEKDND